jgi:hypothetical protein
MFAKFGKDLVSRDLIEAVKKVMDQPDEDKDDQTEELKGGQVKLDKNHNGKLDSQDFKMLRAEKKGVAESGDKYKIKSIGSDVDKESGERRDYYISPSTGKKVYKSGVNKGDHEVPKTGEIKKKINEAEPDYKSSAKYRGKVGDFNPKASDVGQGRKIVGKMGKYGKQPDDDEKMVEPPKDHTVGAVKTDPSAVVPGHSTMAAKLHLASLPKDKEGNPIVKGARKVSAADLVAKRKAMMAGQKNEEVESLEEKKWIAGAIKHPGGLHKALGVPQDKKIPASKVAAAATKGGHVGKMARLAQTLKGLKKEEYVEEGMEDTLHPAGAALLKHIKPQHHNLYKPHLAKDTFNGSYKDRTAVLKAAKDAGHLKMDLRKQNEEVEEIEEALNKQHTDFYDKNPHFKRDDRETKSLDKNRLATKISPSGGVPKVKKKSITSFTSGQKNEEVESITEGKMDKMTLSGLWHKHAQHSYMSDQGYGLGSGSMHHNDHAATAIENHVRKHYGNKVADDMVAHSEHHVAHAEYAGPESSPHHEKEAEKLRKKHNIHGDLYGETFNHVTEKVDPNVRTTDTLKGRIAGGEPNQHTSYKVKLETKGTGAMDRIKSAAKSAFDRVKNETMMGKAGATSEAKKLDKEGY